MARFLTREPSIFGLQSNSVALCSGQAAATPCIYSAPATSIKPGNKQKSTCLRHYPMRFACHLAQHVDSLKASCRGQPLLPDILPPATETFRLMSYNQDAQLWSNLELSSVFTYLRGSKKLQIPSQWKDLVPRCFPAAETQ